MILSDRDIKRRVALKGYLESYGGEAHLSEYLASIPEPTQANHFQALEIVPWMPLKCKAHGMSYGLSCAGYDIRIAQELTLEPDDFRLASSLEWIKIPTDLEVELKDKSSWARQGLSVFNTVQEPGWCGHLTIELKNGGHNTIHIPQGAPIGQYVFKQMTSHADNPYDGKYNNQPDRPVEWIAEMA